MIGAVLLALASAAFSALGATLEQHAAKRESPTRTLDPRLLARLLRRRLWLVGWVPDTTGTVLQAAALHLGSLALVEMLLVSGLFMAIPLEAALERRRPHARDLVVVTMGVASLGAFLIATDPRAGVAQPSPLAWAGVVLGVGAAFAVCLVGGWRTQEATRGTLLGIAAGLLYGVAAALLKAVTVALATDPLGVFGRWELYALVLTSLGGLALQQNAFQSGPIAAPLTAVTIVEPLSGLVIAVTAFHERLATGGARLPVALVALVVMCVAVGVASTTRSR